MQFQLKGTKEEVKGLRREMAKLLSQNNRTNERLKENKNNTKKMVKLFEKELATKCSVPNKMRH